MDLLLRLLERRFIIGLSAILGAIWAWGRWGGHIQGLTDLMLHPPAETSSPLSAAIKKDAAARESAKLKTVHRAVTAEISQAAANGFNVEKLQRIADSALALDAPAYRSAAIDRLNKLRLAIPQKREAFRPAAAGDLNPDHLDNRTPKGKAARR